MKTLTTIFFSAFYFFGFCQNSKLISEWVNSIENSNYYQYSFQTIDSMGNIYIATSFLDSITISKGSFFEKFTSIYENDILIIKINREGEYEWVKQVEGRGDDYPTTIKVDSNGDILIAGIFNNISDFDPMKILFS
ncbi:MAG: SBBP repeat-containing protein [Saprospiraceae bacterium]|nr:SBBP repeat-containing protein [Saprospiraceae bacterium]